MKLRHPKWPEGEYIYRYPSVNREWTYVDSDKHECEYRFYWIDDPRELEEYKEPVKRELTWEQIEKVIVGVYKKDLNQVHGSYLKAMKKELGFE